MFNCAKEHIEILSMQNALLPIYFLLDSIVQSAKKHTRTTLSMLSLDMSGRQKGRGSNVAVVNIRFSWDVGRVPLCLFHRKIYVF